MASQTQVTEQPQTPSKAKKQSSENKKEILAAQLDEKYNLIRECPVFRPTLHEFCSVSFSDYLVQCEMQCGTSGIFKVKKYYSQLDSLNLQVVAPDGWTARQNGYDDVKINVKSKLGTSQRSHILFKEPIEQNVNG